MTWLEKRVISVLGIVMALLAVVLLVVLGLRYQAARTRQEKEETLAAIAEAEAEETVLNTSPFSALTYTNNTATLSFSVDKNGQWVWSDDTSFPLDTTMLATILEELTSWDPLYTVGDPAVISASGISRPEAVLTATMAEEDGVIRLTFGGTTESGGRYVAVNDDLDTLYVIEDVLCPLLCAPIYDMYLLPELPALSEDNLRTVIVQGSPDEEGGGVATVLVAQRTALTDTVSWRTGSGDVTENESVRALLGDLAALKLEKCIIYRPSDGAVEMCGFDTPARLSLTYLDEENGAEAQLEIRIGNRVLEGNGRYVMVNDDPSIYLLSTELLDPLMRISVSGLAQ